jgi:queuine tRNA-ribosyltransferase
MFTIEARDTQTQARTGTLITRHGPVRTPLFMPVATKGTVKTLTAREVGEIGYEVILSNVYHLLERPGIEVIEDHGGLHGFMSWDGAILTDSGGYQVYSLHKMVRVEEDGVAFRSLIDGRERRFTPELVLGYQERLGSDIAMQLDVCLPYGASREATQDALERTLRWGERTLAARALDGQLVFGIVQGGFYEDLREESARRTVELGFDGYALGGLSLGEPREELLAMTTTALAVIPEDKPRYVMGLGDPPGILEAIALGVDMFDSALATRVARGGAVFTPEGVLTIRNARYERDTRPLVEGCTCPACRQFTRAYLRHLYLSEETLALRMFTAHNLTFIQQLLAGARSAIEAGRYLSYLEEWRKRFREGRAS